MYINNNFVNNNLIYQNGSVTDFSKTLPSKIGGVNTQNLQNQTNNFSTTLQPGKRMQESHLLQTSKQPFSSIPNDEPRDRYSYNPQKQQMNNQNQDSINSMYSQIGSQIKLQQNDQNKYQTNFIKPQTQQFDSVQKQYNYNPEASNTYQSVNQKNTYSIQDTNMNLSSERSYNNKNGQQQYFLSVQASKNNQDNYKAKNNNNQSYTTLNNLTSSYNKEISSINNTNSKLQDYSQQTQQKQQQPQQYQQFGNVMNTYSNTNTRVKQYNNQINNIQEKNQQSHNSNRQELSQSKEYINKELNKNQQYDKNYNNRNQNQNDNVKYQQQRHTDYIKPSINSAIKNVNLNLTAKTNNKYNYQHQQQQKISNMEPQYRLSERALKTEGDDIDANYIPGSQKSSHQKTTSLANNLPEESQYSQANQQQNRVFSQFKNITKSLSDKQEGLGSYNALQNQVESQQSIKDIQSFNSLSDSANITNNQQQNQKKFLNVVNIEEKQEEYEENQETQRNQNNTDINHLHNKDSNNKYLNGTQKVYLNQNYTQQKKHNGANETQVQNFGSFSEKIQNYHSINNVPQNSNQLQLNNQQKYQKINNIDKEQNFNKGEKNLFLQLSKEDQERIYDNLKINCKICSSEMINCNERSPWTCYICNEQNQGIRCSNRIICKNHKDISICSCCQQKLNQNQLVVESMIKQIQKMDQNKQKRLKCQHCQNYLQNFTVQGWNQKWQCSRCRLNKNDLQQIFRMKCQNHDFNMCAVCVIQPFIN